MDMMNEILFILFILSKTSARLRHSPGVAQRIQSKTYLCRNAVHFVRYYAGVQRWWVQIYRRLVARLVISPAASAGNSD